VQGYSTIVVLVMSAIGCSMIPIFIMPEIMQKIAVVSVNYWGIQGFYDIFLNLLPITDITFLSKVFVLIGIGTLLNFKDCLNGQIGTGYILHTLKEKSSEINDLRGSLVAGGSVARFARESRWGCFTARNRYSLRSFRSSRSRQGD
jgi:hypothetical protein